MRVGVLEQRARLLVEGGEERDESLDVAGFDLPKRRPRNVLRNSLVKRVEIKPKFYLRDAFERTLPLLSERIESSTKTAIRKR